MKAAPVPNGVSMRRYRDVPEFMGDSKRFSTWRSGCASSDVQEDFELSMIKARESLERFAKIVNNKRDAIVLERLSRIAAGTGARVNHRHIFGKFNDLRQFHRCAFVSNLRRPC